MLSSITHNTVNPIQIINIRGEVLEGNSAKVLLSNRIIINNLGEIISAGSDHKVYEYLASNRFLDIGDIRSSIKIQRVYAAFIENNVKSAKDFPFMPFRKWYTYVKTNGKWDLKNREDLIFGYPTSLKYYPSYLFNNTMMEAQDIGNHHFGIITLAANIGLTEEEILRGAGQYQIRSGTSKKKMAKILYFHR